jgi:glycosyltransferase involved in cell wall biosynthesis
MTSPSLFVGVTSWNSSLFLERSLPALRSTRAGRDCRLVVWDNASTDGSVALARRVGADVVCQAALQGQALSELAAMARSELVLLMHSDVILLADDWFDLCVAFMDRRGAALVSPEDVGCGPYSRPFGAGMPESSFLLFRRDALARLARWTWGRGAGSPFPRRRVPFDGAHITHHLPGMLAAERLSWAAMEVHPSDLLPDLAYGPYSGAWIWSAELSRLRYGLGNFYSVDGVITHYHNWYERIPLDVDEAPDPARRSFPRQYIRDYTMAFLRDFDRGAVRVPEARPRDREPVAL